MSNSIEFNNKIFVISSDYPISQESEAFLIQKIKKGIKEKKEDEPIVIVLTDGLKLEVF